jgi:hypothetical protein
MAKVGPLQMCSAQQTVEANGSANDSIGERLINELERDRETVS